jgi:hypothetical protein
MNQFDKVKYIAELFSRILCATLNQKDDKSWKNLDVREKMAFL